MNHPLLQRYYLAVYMGVWSLLCVVQALRIIHFTGVPVYMAVMDAVVSSLIFIVLGFSLWYFVVYNWNQKIGIWHAIMHYFFAGIVVIAFWGAGSYIILLVVLNSDPMFIDYYSDSLIWRLGSGHSIYILIILSYVMILNNRALKEKVGTEVRLREHLKEAELNLLKSQINPHFLFNSLNSVSLLTLTDSARAHEMIVALSEYLRYSISGSHEKFSKFQLELENTRRYLDIEKIRFGDKLKVIFDVEESCFLCLVPTMILQPLYENAIKHGVYEATGQVEIRTWARVEGGFLHMKVENTFEHNVPARKGSGLGIPNVRGRLQMLYGSEHSWLQVQKSDGLYTASMSLPVRFA